MYDLHIEKIFYLSDSVLMVLTRALEFRLFYTQKFNHGMYTKNYKYDDSPLKDGQQKPDEQEVFGRRRTEVLFKKKEKTSQIDG